MWRRISIWSVLAGVLCFGLVVLAGPEISGVSVLVSDANLVSWWEFDEGSGTTAYDSAGGNDGNVNGDPCWTSGRIDGALSFDGIDDYVDIGDPPDGSLDFGSSTDFTISLWFKTSQTGTGFLINKRAKGSGPSGYDLYVAAGQVVALISAGSSFRNVITPQTFNDDRWYHLVAVYDRDDTIRIYIDGVNIATSGSISVIGNINNSQAFSIGDRNDPEGHAYFDGMIDIVRIYSKVLSGEEITELYGEGFGGRAFNPKPSDGATGTNPNGELIWSTGTYAASHDVYFGTDYNDVNDATSASDEYMGREDTNTWNMSGYNQGNVGLETTYYWRVDEVNGAETWKGNTWSLTTRKHRLYVLVDADGSGDFDNIQAGINMAGVPDTVMVARGMYTGAGNYNIDFGGKAITVRSSDPEDPCVVAATVVDCKDVVGRRGFYFHSGEGPDSVVSGLTIKRGRVSRYGGGIYCSGASPTIEHCIIVNNNIINYSWHDTYGGGIYCTSGSNSVIINCTVSNNESRGCDGFDFGMDGTDSYGGGIYCSSDSNAIIENCIISENEAYGGNASEWDPGDGGSAYGGGLCCDSGVIIRNCTIINNVVAGGGGLTPGSGVGGGVKGSGAATITDSIIWGNGDDVYGCSATYSCIEDGDAGIGNISANPSFVSGPDGDYYLSQTAAGQGVDSPCVDAGSDTASNLGLEIYTTRTDEIVDTAAADMGYHYPVTISADTYGDLHIDFFDYGILASDWLECNSNGLAGDITRDSCVDGDDLGYFVDCWLDCYVAAGSAPRPTNGENGTNAARILAWSAGDGALYHDVYLGTDASAVASAGLLSDEFMGTVADANFDPCGLDLETTYYWRIDEVGPRCTTRGDVWNFTTWDGFDPNLNLNLVSWWKFDEGSGTTAYDSGGSNDGALVNGPIWTSGQINGALEFDDVDDYVSFGTGPAITGTGPFSVSAWVETDSMTAGTIVAQRSTGSATGSYGVVILADGRVQFHTYNGGYGLLFQSDVAVDDGLWHHVAAVRANSTDGQIYVDGRLSGSDSGPARSLNSVPVWIGGREGISGSFDGVMDDVRVYDRPLSAGEVWQLYQDGL